MSLYVCDVTQTAKYNTSPIFYCRSDETFWGRVSKFSTNFEESLSRAYWNFEDRSKVLEPSRIII